MVEAITAGRFAELCDVNPSAVSRAAQRGTINVRAGRVLLDAAAEYYRERAMQRGVERILLTRKVSGGWAALCFKGADGEWQVSTVYPPYDLGEDDDCSAIMVLEDGKMNTKTGRLTVDGVERETRLVYDKASPPPWLVEALAEGEKVRARVRQLRKPAGKLAPKARKAVRA